MISAAAIVLAGMLLTRNAERISASLGLSSAWAGALLLPLATSLPELVTSWRAVVIDAPDLAGGNIFGSVLFNLTLIALIDIVQGPGPLVTNRKNRLAFTAILSIGMLSLSAAGIFLALPYRIGWVGIDTVAILIVYLSGSTLLVRLEKSRFSSAEGGLEDPNRKKPPTLSLPLFYFVLAALIIIVAGTYLTDAADAIAESTGLSKTLVGSLLLAVATSLPEVVTTVTAVRLGFVEMAVANVFGANFFNVLLLFFADLFYREGALLASLSTDNILTAGAAILLTLIALFGLVYPLRRDVLWMGWPSVSIVMIYLLMFVFLFYQS